MISEFRWVRIKRKSGSILLDNQQIFGLPSLYETLTIFRKLFSFYPYNIPYLTLENTSIILWLTLNGIIILKIYLRKYSPKIKKYCHLIVTRHRKSQESP